MSDAANPYADVRSLVEELTLGAGRLARGFLAAAEAAKDKAEKAELSREFDRQFRSVRVGAAYLVRLDEAAIRVGRDRRVEAGVIAKARVDARKDAAYQGLKDAPAAERRPQLDRLYSLARDLKLSDDDFLDEVSRVLEVLDDTPDAPALVAAPVARPRTQAEIASAALAAKRLAEPPRRRSG